MNTFAAFSFVFVAGMLQAVGAVMNGALNKAMVNPWLAMAISFLLVLFLAIGLFACMPKPLPSTGEITQMPSWAPLGG